MNIPYVKQGAPYVDHPTNPDATYAASDANAMDDGIYAAHLQPCVRAYHNASQNTSSGVALALALNSERFDQAGGAASTQHDTSSNNSRLTCRYAGVYEIIGHASFVASGGGTFRQLSIRLNGSMLIGIEQSPPTGASQQVPLTVCAHYLLAVNDYVELMAAQDAGTLAVSSLANYSPEFSMARVG